MTWKERNKGYFEEASPTEESLINRIKFYIASWGSILPHFKEIPIATIVRSWEQVVEGEGRGKGNTRNQCLWHSPKLNYIQQIYRKIMTILQKQDS